MKETDRTGALATTVNRSTRSAKPREHSKRRRRAPEIAESEILDAAERLLRRVPFRKLTIGALMATCAVHPSISILTISMRCWRNSRKGM